MGPALKSGRRLDEGEKGVLRDVLGELTGEAGTAGAPAAVINAINDAIRPLDARLNAHPATPERILAALGTVTES